MADPEATWRSYDLFARYVIPHFKGAVAAGWRRRIRALGPPALFERQRDAIIKETEDYRAER